MLENLRWRNKYTKNWSSAPQVITAFGLWDFSIPRYKGKFSRIIQRHRRNLELSYKVHFFCDILDTYDTRLIIQRCWLYVLFISPPTHILFITTNIWPTCLSHKVPRIWCLLIARFPSLSSASAFSPSLLFPSRQHSTYIKFAIVSHSTSST
jgi:hypothetical protein